jgi:hypothetical protein
MSWGNGFGDIMGKAGFLLAPYEKELWLAWGFIAFIFSAISGVGCSLFSIFSSHTQVSNIFGGSPQHTSLRTSHLTYSAKLVLRSPMIKLIQNDSTALTP